MGFGDKFKDLAKQAQDAVAEHKEQIVQAVDNASVLADQRTGGKYTDKIAKVGQKAEQAVEKMSSSDAEAGSEGPAFDEGPADATEQPSSAAATEQPAADAKPLSFD